MNSLQGEIIESHENSKCFRNFSNKLYNKLLILDQKWFPFLIFLMIYSAKNSEFVFRIEPSAYHAFFSHIKNSILLLHPICIVLRVVHKLRLQDEVGRQVVLEMSTVCRFSLILIKLLLRTNVLNDVTAAPFSVVLFAADG